ncbi:DUF4231 domain-containing protein [Nocardia sp. CA-107356]|uniref:DUF4231 domain-containing protein n=1 Tax=Nocardia sp. CA-107356 TaxID=3239972 RepID=UPI003D8A7BCE
MNTPADDGDSADPVWRRLEDQLGWYRSRGAWAQSAYKRVKVAQIVVSAVVPVLAAAGVTGWVTACVAAVVVIAEGVQQMFQWQSTWLLYRGTAEALKRERFLYVSEAGPYTGPERRRVLAERMDAIMAGETASWAEQRTPSATD